MISCLAVKRHGYIAVLESLRVLEVMLALRLCKEQPGHSESLRGCKVRVKLQEEEAKEEGIKSRIQC